MNRPSEELIFDRTQGDVLNKTPKGKYEYTDLNRIEEWCEYLAEILNSYSYNVNITVKTNWTRLDMPTVSKIERIRQNVLQLKNAYYSFTQVPINLNFMTFEKANDIEKILNEIDILLVHMENYFVYCGVLNCGQNRMWQQRFRKPKTWIAQPYKLSQYDNADKLSMIATATDEQVETTEKLHLALYDKRNSVYSSIEAINDSMNIIDELVGESEGN